MNEAKQAASEQAPAAIEPKGNLSVDALANLLQRRYQASDEPANDNAAPPSPTPESDTPASVETTGDDATAAAEAPAPEAGVEQPEPETASAIESPQEPPTSETTEPPAEPGSSKLSPEVAEAIAEAKLDGGLAKTVKRIHHLVDERDAERNRRLEAEAKLAELEATPPAPASAPTTGNDPLTRHPAIAAADKELADVRAVLAWADANPDGAEVTDSKGGARTYEAAEVRAIRANAEERKTTLVAERAATMAQLRTAHQAAAAQARAEAVKVYPWLADTKNPLHRQAAAILADVPELRRLVKCELAIGDMLRGQEMRLKGQTEAGGLPVTKVPANRVPPKVVTSAPPAASRTNPLQKEIQAAEAHYRKTGKATDYQRVVALKAKSTAPERVAA